MKRLVVMYGAIHVNVLLVSLYLVGWLNGAWLTVLQVTFLALLLWSWKRFKFPKRNLSLKERGLWVCGSLGVMVSIALIMSALFSGSEPNQETLVTVQDQIPVLSFIFFLLNASVVGTLVSTNESSCVYEFPLCLSSSPIQSIHLGALWEFRSHTWCG